MRRGLWTGGISSQGDSKRDHGQLQEPYEKVVLDIQAEHQGTVLDDMGIRKAEIDKLNQLRMAGWFWN